jgi:hypothetical protein
MADEKTPPTASDIEGAEPQSQPDNVVTDNSGQVPVQPVGTSDPTLDDNTNPKVPFDGSDPRNIPPHDSNEQLHIAASKRIGAELGTNLTTAAGTRREAVKAAYDNSKDVRDVLPSSEDTETATPEERRELGDEAIRRSQAAAGNRAQPPANRRSKPETTTKA